MDGWRHLASECPMLRVGTLGFCLSQDMGAWPPQKPVTSEGPGTTTAGTHPSGRCPPPVSFTIRPHDTIRSRRKSLWAVGSTSTNTGREARRSPINTDVERWPAAVKEWVPPALPFDLNPICIHQQQAAALRLQRYHIVFSQIFSRFLVDFWLLECWTALRWCCFLDRFYGNATVLSADMFISMFDLCVWFIFVDQKICCS